MDQLSDDLPEEPRRLQVQGGVRRLHLLVAALIAVSLFATWLHFHNRDLTLSDCREGQLLIEEKCVEPQPTLPGGPVLVGT